MHTRPVERHIIAMLGKRLPDGSRSALFLGDLLKDGPATEPGEPRFVADAQSSIIALLGAVWLFPAIGVSALVDSLWGHEAANVTLALVVVPTVFLIALAAVIQLAKYRGRFDGVQPRLGRLSRAACFAVVAAVAAVVSLGGH